ncbi:tetratricopeptide repeat protein [Pseudobutyrivibrio sp.]|uniref:tetratricopeptide repeat protein n=1 Tax=Pseudobutyrivibrio sp. TaxID=2014367 RepID=UPI001E0B7196|nr:tetratricopeptide repeat protein [Pseudobutyrivibrio sp.]MBE5909526.1 hypothetical protein [Pseudobutyrivibrio sp.]
MNRVKKRAHIVIALCLVLVLCACGASKLEKQLDLGAKYLEELDYDNAIAAYTAAIDVDPASIDAYVGLAKAYVGKADSLEDYTESLDTILLAYTTIDDMLSDSKTEFVGTEETLDSAKELRTSIEATFASQYFQILYDLNTNDAHDEIESLKEKYGEIVDEIIDTEDPKSIDEIDIDDESKQLYKDFIDGKNSFVYNYKSDEFGNGFYDVLDEYLNNNSSYTLNDIIDAYKSNDSFTVGDYRYSFIDCGKDGNYELLLELDYTTEDEYSKVYYTAFMVFRNNGGNLELSYIDGSSELHYISAFGDPDEVWPDLMHIYYNGLVYNWVEFGSDITGYRYSVGYIDADGKYNQWYNFEEEYTDYNYDFSENQITFADDEDNKYYYLTRGYIDIKSDEYNPIQLADNVTIDSSIENAEMFLVESALLENSHNQMVSPSNFKYNSFEEVVKLIEDRRQDIGLTDNIYFK